MEGMGVGRVMNVERRMPMGEGVIVVLIVSSMSVMEVSFAFHFVFFWCELVKGTGKGIPEITAQPSGPAKYVFMGP